MLIRTTCLYYWLLGVSMHLKLPIALAFAIAAASPASAKCINAWPKTDEDYFRNAETVFIGQVISADSTGSTAGPFQKLAASYKLLETFKGTPSTEGEISFMREPHSILLKHERTYLFFLGADQFVSICNGSREFSPEFSEQSAQEQKTYALLKILRDEGAQPALAPDPAVAASRQQPGG